MTKKKKFTIASIVVILIIILLSLIYIFLAPKFYLKNKYGNEYEFEFVKYSPIHYDSYDGGFIFSAKALVNDKWEFICNGVTFQLQRVDLKFVDDYQLEQVSNLCVEYFQNNVDNSIIHVGIDTKMIFDTNKKCESNIVWNETNIDEFLRNQISLNIICEHDIDEYYIDDIKRKLSENLIFINDINAYKYNSNMQLKRFQYGYDDNEHYMIDMYDNIN